MKQILFHLFFSLCAQIDSLEGRCEELQKSLDEMTVAQETVRRRQRRSLCTPDEPEAPQIVETVKSGLKKLPLETVNNCDEEVTQLLQQLQESRTQRGREQRKIQELEEQLKTLIQVIFNFILSFSFSSML